MIELILCTYKAKLIILFFTKNRLGFLGVLTILKTFD